MIPVLIFALAFITLSPACDWQEIDHASIQIDRTAGGYRAIFDGGNYTFSGEGPEMLPALDSLMATLWCEWAHSREAA